MNDHIRDRRLARVDTSEVGSAKEGLADLRRSEGSEELKRLCSNRMAIRHSPVCALRMDEA